MLMIIFFALIAGLVVVVAVDASAVFLARRSLSSAVDGAALAAAQSVSDADFYTAGAPLDALPLGDVQRVVDDYAARYRASADDPTVEMDAVVVNGGFAVRVVARRQVSLPLARAFGFDRVTVEADATARSPLR